MTWGTFTPPYAPIPGTEDKPEYKILQADFGDGYTQSTADGLNNVRRVLTVAWDGLTVAEANAIINFFVDQTGLPAVLLHALERDGAGQVDLQGPLPRQGPGRPAQGQRHLPAELPARRLK